MTLPLGKVVGTPGALKALEESGVNPLSLLLRHSNNDWGTLSQDDRQANLDALRTGERVFSVYILPTGVKLWCITEAQNDEGVRESTCLLLPSDY